MLVLCAAYTGSHALRGSILYAGISSFPFPSVGMNNSISQPLMIHRSECSKDLRPKNTRTSGENYLNYEALLGIDDDEVLASACIRVSLDRQSWNARQRPGVVHACGSALLDDAILLMQRLFLHKKQDTQLYSLELAPVRGIRAAGGD